MHTTSKEMMQCNKDDKLQSCPASLFFTCRLADHHLAVSLRKEGDFFVLS